MQAREPARQCVAMYKRRQGHRPCAVRPPSARASPGRGALQGKGDAAHKVPTKDCATPRASREFDHVSKPKIGVKGEFCIWRLHLHVFFVVV